MDPTIHGIIIDTALFKHLEDTEQKVVRKIKKIV